MATMARARGPDRFRRVTVLARRVRRGERSGMARRARPRRAALRASGFIIAFSPTVWYDNRMKISTSACPLALAKFRIGDV